MVEQNGSFSYSLWFATDQAIGRNCRVGRGLYHECFLWVDENFKKIRTNKSLRQHGSMLKVTAQVVVTMAIMDEWLSIGTDKGMGRYFKDH